MPLVDCLSNDLHACETSEIRLLIIQQFKGILVDTVLQYSYNIICWGVARDIQVWVLHEETKLSKV